jgi:hypothetical protein
MEFDWLRSKTRVGVSPPQRVTNMGLVASVDPTDARKPVR